MKKEAMARYEQTDDPLNGVISYVHTKPMLLFLISTGLCSTRLNSALLT